MKAGIPLFLFGAVVFVASWSYEIGQLRRMGPGYFPMLLGATLCLFAVLISLQDVWKGIARDTPSEAPILPSVHPRQIWRPLLLPLFAILLFASLLNTAGLVPAVIASVTCAGLAERSNSIRSVVAIAFATAVFTALVFVYGLGVPLRLFVL